MNSTHTTIATSAMSQLATLGIQDHIAARRGRRSRPAKPAAAIADGGASGKNAHIR
jgi:hypothetical protein